MFFTRKKLRDHLKKGAIALEMLGIIAAMGLFIGFAANQSAKTREISQGTQLAQQLNLAAKAAQNYLDSNAAVLTQALASQNHIIVNQGNVTNSSGTAITLGTGLKANNGLRDYMPMTFNQTRWGQNVRMYVYKGADGAIHALLTTTGGRPAASNFASSPDRAPYMAAARQAASMNGFGIYQARNPAGTAVNQVVGPHNSWRFVPANANYGSVPASAFNDGQLARPLYAYSAAVKDDMLYRTAIDGHPELNAMQADLHMNGHKLTGVGTITISQKAPIAGASGQYATADSGGNGLVIEPYTTTGTINGAASQVCSATGYKKPDGFLFTMNKKMNDGGTNNDGSGSNPNGQTVNDLNGVWMCMGGQARLLADSANSTTIKGMSVRRAGEVVKKPRCPDGQVPAIYVTPAAMAATASATSNIQPLVAYQAYADNAPTQWTVRIRVKSTEHGDNAWFTPASNSPYNHAVVHTACERTGTGLTN